MRFYNRKFYNNVINKFESVFYNGIDFVNPCDFIVIMDKTVYDTGKHLLL